MKKMKKVLSILLVLSVVLSYVPTTAFAAAEDNLCVHHTGHTADCGYVAAVAGSDCTHDHDEACGYAEPVAEVKCACEATDESGALVHTEGCGYVAPVAGSPCNHTHDDACGYTATVEGHGCEYVCEECKEQEEPQTDAAVEAVQTQINALPTVEEISALTFDEKVALYNGAYLAAGNAYNALSDEQKAGVDAAKLMALGDYFADPSNLQTLDETAHTCNGITWTGITSMGSYLSSGNYYLKNDIQCANNITVNGTVNLCLNGKSLTSNNATPKKITISSGATLNIYDCGNTGTSSLVIKNEGTLHIYGGTYGGTYIVNGRANYTKLIENSGTLYIHKAKVESDIDAIVNTGTLTIDNGSFEVASTWTDVNCVTNEGGTVTINGGTFTSSSSHTIYNGGPASQMTIKGGTFSNTGTSSAIYVPGGTCTITNGDFQADDYATISTGSSGTCKISGGDFKSSSGKYVLERFYGQGSIVVSGGTFSTSGSGAKIRISNDGLSGGKFTDGIEGYYYLAEYLAEGYACYQNDKICTLANDQKSITGDTVEVKKITYSVTVTADPTEGGTVTGAGSYAEGAEVILTASPNESYQFKEWQVTPSTVTITDNKFTMPASSVEIKAVFAEEVTEHKHAVTSGGEELTWTPITKLTEITAPGNYYLSTDIGLNTNPTINVSGTVNLCLNGHSLTEKKYTVTIADGTTLNLCDCAENSTGSIGCMVENSGTINLYSGAFSIDNDKCIINNATLNVYGGTITNTSGFAIQNTGKLNIYGGTLEARKNCILHEGGTTNISGNPTLTTTYSYSTIDARANMTISGGTFKNTAGSNVLTTAGGTPVVTISGGSFESSGAVIQSNFGTINIENGTFSGGAGKNILAVNSYLNVSGGTFSGGSNPVTVYFYSRGQDKCKLSGGTFQNGITVEKATDAKYTVYLADILADDYAYYYYQNNQKGEVVTLTTYQGKITGGDVTVAKKPVVHKHALNDGEELTWTAITSLSDITGAGSYYLAQDVAVSNTTISVSGTVNLCLNGHSLTGNSYTVKIAEGTTLNLCDCVENSTGSIGCAIENNGTMNIYSGVFSIANQDCIINNATLNVFGGTITNTSGYAINNKGTLKIEGGTFTANGNCIYHESGTANISGSPSFNSTGSKSTIDARADMTISGGTFENTGTSLVLYTTGPNANITVENGTFTSGEKVVYSMMGTINIENGTFSGGTDAYILQVNSNLNISGGTFSGGSNPVTVYFYSKGEDKCKLSGGIFQNGITIKKANDANYTVYLADILADDYAYYYYQNNQKGEVVTLTPYQGAVNSTVTVDKKLVKITGEVTISGTHEYGETLTADYSKPDETVTYQWYRGETAIDGATETTYALTAEDIGQKIKVVVTGTGAYTGTATSDPVTVEKATPSYTDPTDLTATYGDTLAKVTLPTAENGTWSWADDTASVGNVSATPNTFEATFTPTETEFYKTVTVSVPVTVSAKSLNSEDITVTLSDNVIFNGQPIPETTVKDGDTLLVKDSDYTVTQTGSNGEFTMTITGMGNYKDEAATKPTYLVVDLPDPKDVEPDDKDAIDAYDRYAALNETYKDEELAKALEELKAALTAYDIIYQSAKSYVKGSGKTLTFTANGYYAEYGSYVEGAYGKFVSVEIDGKTLDAANYTVVAGSTVITLKTSYLESLSAGKHYIKVNYIDGSTDGKDFFRISINNGNPFTGDDSHMLLWGGLAMVSLLCAAMAVLLAGKKKGKYQR